MYPPPQHPTYPPTGARRTYGICRVESVLALVWPHRAIPLRSPTPLPVYPEVPGAPALTYAIDLRGMAFERLVAICAVFPSGATPAQLDALGELVVGEDHFEMIV